MAQQPAHRNLFLARLRELWPVRGDRRVEVEQATLREQTGARRGRAFGRGEHHLQCLVGVRLTRHLIAYTAIQVGHHHAIDEEREPGADFALLEEIAGERLVHTFEASIHVALDLDVDHGRATSPRFQMITSSTGRLGEGLKSSPFVYATGISATWNQLVGIPSTSAIST